MDTMYHYPDDSLALHTDLYEINMMLTYWEKGIDQRHAIFELYYRKNPFGSGYAVFAGLERSVNYLNALHFSDSDIAYLRKVEDYPEAFLTYLQQMDLKLTIRAPREGEVVFADEPLFQVEGPLAQCQLVETALLNIVNYQTLVATKASRIRSA